MDRVSIIRPLANVQLAWQSLLRCSGGCAWSCASGSRLACYASCPKYTAFLSASIARKNVSCAIRIQSSPDTTPKSKKLLSAKSGWGSELTYSDDPFIVVLLAHFWDLPHPAQGRCDVNKGAASSQSIACRPRHCVFPPPFAPGRKRAPVMVGQGAYDTLRRERTLFQLRTRA